MQLEVLTPKEVGDWVEQISAQLNPQGSSSEDSNEASEPVIEQVMQRLSAFHANWSTCFDRFGSDPKGELSYRGLGITFREEIYPTLARLLKSDDGSKAYLESFCSQLHLPQPPMLGHLRASLLERRRQGQKSLATLTVPKFDRPLFIVSAPRAGSTLLFETLSQLRDLWTIGTESHEIIEGISGLHPRSNGFQSNQLTEQQATEEIGHELRRRFAGRLRKREGERYLDLSVQQRPEAIRFLEKTPKNALRIPFLKSIFPGAQFIYLYREPKGNISSMIEGWRSRRYVSYRRLPNWSAREWSFLLPPGYENLTNCAIADVAAYQWKAANENIMRDLSHCPTGCWHFVSYSDLTQSPKSTIQDIGHFADLAWDQTIEERVCQDLPLSSMSFSQPSPDKWRKNEQEMLPLLPGLDAVAERVLTFSLKSSGAVR